MAAGHDWYQHTAMSGVKAHQTVDSPLTPLTSSSPGPMLRCLRLDFGAGRGGLCVPVGMGPRCHHKVALPPHTITTTTAPTPPAPTHRPPAVSLLRFGAQHVTTKKRKSHTCRQTTARHVHAHIRPFLCRGSSPIRDQVSLRYNMQTRPQLLVADSVYKPQTIPPCPLLNTCTEGMFARRAGQCSGHLSQCSNPKHYSFLQPRLPNLT